ncbi:DMT family transporter [Pseudomonas putida]
MQQRSALDGRAGMMMLVLCAIWGLQQVAIKAIATDISPILQIGVRSGVAAVLVAALMFWRREQPRAGDNHWLPGLAIGGLFGLEYLLVGEGLRHTTASHMVIFLYTSPIFAALGLHWKLPAERLKPAQWGGIVLAFLGIVVAFSGHGSQGTSTLLGDALGLAAGAAWGATTVVVRTTRLSGAPATQTLLYQLLGACVLLLAAAVALHQASANFTPTVVVNLTYQVLVMSFASLLAWFWLLRTYLASRLGVLAFLTPLYGIGFGVWLLDEPLEARFLMGAALVTAGILCVSGYEWFSQRKGKLKARAPE